MTAALFLPPVPVIFRARMSLCMLRDFPPMNVSSTSTSPLHFIMNPFALRAEGGAA